MEEFTYEKMIKDLTLPQKGIIGKIEKGAKYWSIDNKILRIEHLAIFCDMFTFEVRTQCNITVWPKGHSIWTTTISADKLVQWVMNGVPSIST